jgi:hypothetical protein
MIKEIKYETKDINEVVLDLADEIKNGWKLYSFELPNVEMSCYSHPNFIVEVALTKEFKDGKNL